MRLLISLMLVTAVAGAQEVREPQRGEERREPRVERPEPVRVQPPVQEPRRNEPPRQVEPQRPIDRPPVVRPVNPPVFMDPWMRNRPCFDRWNCRPMVEFEVQFHNRRPSRLEMAPLRETLTERQKKQLLQLRKEYRQKVQKILNNP